MAEFGGGGGGGLWDLLHELAWAGLVNWDGATLHAKLSRASG